MEGDAAVAQVLYSLVELQNASRDGISSCDMALFAFEREHLSAGLVSTVGKTASAKSIGDKIELSALNAIHRLKPSLYKAKCDNFYMKFIREEQSVVLNILRWIESEFTYGNSIYPSDTPAKLFEYIERRKHITAAIANCYVLKQEILYVIRVLPVDINKFYHYEKAIDAQIALYKGVRQSDNRFLKSKRKTIDVSKDITAISDCIIAILNKIVNAG